MTLSTKRKQKRTLFQIEIKFIDSLNFIPMALAILIDIKFIDSLNFISMALARLGLTIVFITSLGSYTSKSNSPSTFYPSTLIKMYDIKYKKKTKTNIVPD